MGLESGDDQTLLAMHKWGDSATIVSQATRVRRAGINLFVTVILGLAGKERSLIHARRTGEALTAMQPDKVGALSLMVVPGTPLDVAIREGRFTLPNSREVLLELRTMLAHTAMDRGYFYANHASNYLPLRVKMPRDKEAAIAEIDRALAGARPLRPEWMRGL